MMYLFSLAILALIIVGAFGIYKTIIRTTNVHIDNEFEETIPFPETIPEVTIGNVKVEQKAPSSIKTPRKRAKKA